MRLAGPASARPEPAGLRVVLDARPLQDPERSPVTARYLEGLLGAYDAEPIPGESFAFLLQSDLDDPMDAFPNLEIVGRRLMPPTRLLRGGALAVDPFLLRGASLGIAWRAERSGAAGAVYHAVAGAAPVFSRLPIVVTLLDLAPWELPGAFQRGPASRFGQRLRRRLVRDAAAVIVASPAVARQARRLLRLEESRVHVVPLAPHPAYATADASSAAALEERRRLGLGERYLVYVGRHDARHDLVTLLRALSLTAAMRRPRGLPQAVNWPPQVLVVGATPDDRAALARAAARENVADALVYAPALPPERLAALVAGARAAVQPALSDAAGLAALDALAAGVPVVATSVGALPDVVGSAGILVGPRDPDRLAKALRAAWADERVHASLRAAAVEREMGRRTWADVAWETRSIYAEVGLRRRD
ncbi:MAG TPA: glycosyltransferase [Candidatus Acidoferrales bacterium]|nr:glycosyltransferase [Candidatus Acidoferrales bacterium]